jgi:hypothetical protein
MGYLWYSCSLVINYMGYLWYSCSIVVRLSIGERSEACNLGMWFRCSIAANYLGYLWFRSSQHFLFL